MKNLKKYIDNWNEDKNLVLITHYVVISEVLNYAPSSGEIVVSDKNFEIKFSFTGEIFELIKSNFLLLISKTLTLFF